MAFKIQIEFTEVAVNCNTWYEYPVCNFLKSALLLVFVYVNYCHISSFVAGV